MTFNVGFEIINNAWGHIKVDDEILEEIAEREGVSLDDMTDEEIWNMLIDDDSSYDDKARKNAFEHAEVGELGDSCDIEIVG